MLGHIRVIPIAAESLGVRSMCTFVETSDTRILLDAGVSLCPNRFNLPPHPKEFATIDECRKKIAASAELADLITISHYHFDHHTPSFEDWLCNWTKKGETARQIYEGKTILVKNPKTNINSSQRHRAWMFQQTSGKYAAKLEIADAKSFTMGKTKIRFSKALPHGLEDSFLGWVVSTVIESERERFMFAPDVQGPMSRQILEFILDEKPDLLLIGGPPSYLTGFKISEAQIEGALRNMAKIARAVKTMIFDHHIIRDEKWREKTEFLRRQAKIVGHEVQTAAEFLGKENMCLEAMRKELFLNDPPAEDFKKWMNGTEDEKKEERPPF